MGIHSITFWTNPILLKNSSSTTIPPNGVRARSVSFNFTFRPLNSCVPSASIPYSLRHLRFNPHGFLAQRKQH